MLELRLLFLVSDLKLSKLLSSKRKWIHLLSVFVCIAFSLRV